MRQEYSLLENFNHRWQQGDAEKRAGRKCDLRTVEITTTCQNQHCDCQSIKSLLKNMKLDHKLHLHHHENAATCALSVPTEKKSEITHLFTRTPTGPSLKVSSHLPSLSGLAL